MKDSVRRIILFVVIVLTGSFLILYDIPIIVMVPLLVAVGFVLLFALGAITIADIRSGISGLKLSSLRQKGVFKKLDSIKIFEKKPGTPQKQPPAKTEAKKIQKPAEKKSGFRQHLDSLVSSIKTLGQIIKNRGKPGKKVEDIDRLLDKTVSEKVRGSALASAGSVASAGGGGAGTAGGNVQDQDPFLSLSGDEIESGLLDSLDGLETETPSAGGASAGEAVAAGGEGSSELVMEGMDMPALPDEVSSSAEAILKENAEAGLEEFSSLEGVEEVDESLGDLDNINIDDIDIDSELPADSTPAEAPAAGTAAAPAAASAAAQAPAEPEMPFSISGNQMPEEQVMQQEEISFAPSPTGDDDLLSSLASEIKHVKKEKDLSLLRDLKDFKAPASDIEQELQDVFTQIKDVGKKGKPSSPSAAKE